VSNLPLVFCRWRSLFCGGCLSALLIYLSNSLVHSSEACSVPCLYTGVENYEKQHKYQATYSAYLIRRGASGLQKEKGKNGAQCIHILGHKTITMYKISNNKTTTRKKATSRCFKKYGSQDDTEASSRCSLRTNYHLMVIVLLRGRVCIIGKC